MKKRLFLHLKRFSALLAALALTACFTGCGSEAKARVRNTFAFDTTVSFTFYDSKDAAAVSNALDRLEYYEKIFSRTLEDSELHQLNERLAEAAKAGTAPVSVPVSLELYEALKLALEYAELTGGAFDPTLGRLLEMYDFSGTEHTVPTEAERAEILSHCGAEKLHLEPLSGSAYPYQLTVDDPEIVIDLGGVAKGYIADCLKKELTADGVTSAIINLGGNLLMIGNKPDGKPFKVGVTKPGTESGEYLDSFELSDGSAVTSGSYQRFFEKDGVTYHHILDPKTGLPAESGLQSVTVVCENSAVADILSTAFFVMGEDAAAEFLKNFTDIDLYIIDNEMNLRKYLHD